MEIMTIKELRKLCKNKSIHKATINIAKPKSEITASAAAIVKSEVSEAISKVNPMLAYCFSTFFKASLTFCSTLRHSHRSVFEPSNQWNFYH